MKTSTKGAICAAACTVGLLLLSGCETTRQGSSRSYDGATTGGQWAGTNTEGGEEGLTVAALPPPELKEFPDLAVPGGFAFDATRSYTNITTKYRIAHFVYEGKLSVGETVNFYRDQMPVNGWKLENVMGPDSKTLDLTKEEGQENRCRIQAIPSTRKTTLIIDIY